MDWFVNTWLISAIVDVIIKILRIGILNFVNWLSNDILRYFMDGLFNDPPIAITMPKAFN